MVLTLESYRDLFRDENALRRFGEVLEAAGKTGGVSSVTLGDKYLISTVSPEDGRRLLTDQILRNFAERPELLDKLTESLEDEEVVE
jgi:hypothetical protein